MATESIIEENKTVVKELFQELDAFLEHDLERAFKAVEEFMYEDCTTYFSSHTLDGLSAYKDHLRGASAAFYDMRHNIVDMIGEGKKVVTRVNFTAKHVGEFLGIKATGRSINTPIIYIHELEDRKIKKCWLDWDSFYAMKLSLEAPDEAAAE